MIYKKHKIDRIYITHISKTVRTILAILVSSDRCKRIRGFVTVKIAKEELMIRYDSKFRTMEVDVEVLNCPNYFEHFFLGLRVFSFHIRENATSR